MKLSTTHLTMIPGCEIMDCPEVVPSEQGVYLVFLEGGRRLLQATGYRRSGSIRLLGTDALVHVYTGAAFDLRKRMIQHFHRDARNSSLRRTLLAIEYARGAISKTNTPHCTVSDEESLSKWLYRNALVGVARTRQAFEIERGLLNRHASPFNITHRRSSAYSRTLMEWRAEQLLQVAQTVTRTTMNAT